MFALNFWIFVFGYIYRVSGAASSNSPSYIPSYGDIRNLLNQQKNGPDDQTIQQYSAVLAASEPLRIACENQVIRKLGPVRRLIGWTRGETPLVQAVNLQKKIPGLDEIIGLYENRFKETIRSFGLTTEQFNEISRSVNTERKLKEKVNVQSYYYKIAANLQTNLREPVPVLPSISAPLQQTMRVNQNVYENLFQKNILSFPLNKRFASALAAIERQRTTTREYLKQKLNVLELPNNMCDPKTLPTMCTAIREACTDFPLAAGEIIEMHGIRIREFNDLQAKMKNNIFFRMKIEKELKSLRSGR